MAQVINNYPGLKKAALLIAYDNGMINMIEPEEKYLRRCDEVVGADGVYHADLQVWNDWLETLTGEQMEVVCCGEEMEMQELMALAPDAVECDPNEFSLTDLLNRFFEAPL